MEKSLSSLDRDRSLITPEIYERINWSTEVCNESIMEEIKDILEPKFQKLEEQLQRLKDELDHYKSISMRYQEDEPKIKKVIDTQEELNKIFTDIAGDMIEDKLEPDLTGVILAVDMAVEFINYATDSGYPNVCSHNVVEYFKLHGMECSLSNDVYVYRGFRFKNDLFVDN